MARGWHDAATTTAARRRQSAQLSRTAVAKPLLPSDATRFPAPRQVCQPLPQSAVGIRGTQQSNA